MKQEKSSKITGKLLILKVAFMYSRFIMDIWGTILHFTSYHYFLINPTQFLKYQMNTNYLFFCIIMIKCFFISFFASITILLYSTLNINVILILILKHFYFDMCICEKMGTCYFVNLYFLVPRA